MRDYDGVGHRYKNEDQNSEEAISVLTGILGFSPNTTSLKYELNLYAGGIGIDDKLAFCFEASEQEIRSVAEKLGLITPLDALRDAGWGEDFAWLIDDDGRGDPVIDLSVKFINQNKKPFQSNCSESCSIYFSRESNVNTWTAVWICESTLNYLSFDQG